MVWIKKNPEWWLATGKDGEFSIFKDRGTWSGIYRINGVVKFRLPRCRRLSEIKSICEENHYWEKK